MAISANSIIHYTNSFDKLVGILKEGFGIKYCAEALVVDDDTKSRAAHPMISFCDIPLSHASRHFHSYGRYGIGLSKKWAHKMGINPVLYLNKNSSISKTIGAFLKERRKETTNLTRAQQRAILRIKCFTKNYSGELKRGRTQIKDYRFYDEREWRLVPEPRQLKGAKFSVSLNRYQRNKRLFNEQIADLRFEFRPKDITYIIVAREDEIPLVIHTIRESYSRRCTNRELSIVYSKICSATAIEDDY